MTAGGVLAVFRWPAKGFGGEQPDTITLTAHGVAGDRVKVLTSDGKRVTALGAPRLLRWRASGHGVTGPDGRVWSWEDPELLPLLEEDLARPLTLEDHPTGRPDVPGTVHLTVEASRAAVADAFGDRPLDIRRFRPNLHVSLDAPPFAEEEWTAGRTLRVGATELTVDHLCDRCAVTTRDPDTAEKWGQVLRWINSERGTFFGVRCRVTRPGPVAPGDPVAIS